MTILIDDWLDRFPLDAVLRPHVAGVLHSLPTEVRDDLLLDPGFMMSDYEPGTGKVALVPVASPLAGRPGRSVVLKRTLRNRPAAFIRYIIAHEFAHAHLRNGGRWPGDDPERAADALAERWGFARP